ncbi:heavy metal-binding domain-containing protein [Flavobacterium eburneipallidum]|uniref:heavy metal-binding domain-containing protein n=1 Tax=Flavobacterium eburneipallidum TaxID=3003263 RepID=UPI0022AC81C5|nr:heavy metal-binding domain-containing protein [Flavobacterium eburneipallidum]
MKNILYLSILFAFASCSIKTHYVQTGGKTYPKTEENSILIYSRTPEKQYEVIGSVAVFAASEKQSLKALKKKAAELGADAIIEINLDKISSVSQATGISGVAVKFK